MTMVSGAGNAHGAFLAGEGRGIPVSSPTMALGCQASASGQGLGPVFGLGSVKVCGCALASASRTIAWSHEHLDCSLLFSLPVAVWLIACLSRGWLAQSRVPWHTSLCQGWMVLWGFVLVCF